MSAILPTLRLLLPAILPSWRFFEEVAPSPRIEVALIRGPAGAADPADLRWREFRPRPARIGAGAMLRRLLWNPEWNETLFLVSTAERFIAEGEEHRRQELTDRLRFHLNNSAAAAGAGALAFRFRLSIVAREGAAIERAVVYVSPPAPLRAEERP